MAYSCISWYLNSLNKLLMGLALCTMVSLSTSKVFKHHQKPAAHQEVTHKLFTAAISGQPESIRALIRLGADANARDKEGNTPLHLAAQEGIASNTQELLANGADPSIKNLSDDTPLDLASKEYQKLIDADENRKLKRLFRKIPESQKTIDSYLNEQKLNQFKRTLSVLFSASLSS